MELADVPRETLAVALALAVTVALGQLVHGTWTRSARRSRLRVRWERARNGEALAAQRLEELGFTIVGAQVVSEHAVQLDDRLVTVPIRADYLVTKGSRTFVVEVKTGAFAPRVETSATRRQLLEYGVAFDVDGVLLVDGDSGAVHAVSFPSLSRLREEEPRRSWGPAFGLVLAALVAVIVWLTR